MSSLHETIPVERSNQSRRWWYASAPIALAVISWCLGGNAIWAWVTVIGALVVIAFTLGSLRVLAQRDLQGGDLIQIGYLLVCWASWAAIGFYLPITTIRVQPDGLNPAVEEPTCPIRVIYDGEIRAEVARGPGCSMRIRGKLRADRLCVQTLATGGWINRSFHHYGGEVKLETIPTTAIYVDNRRRTDCTIRCGQLLFDVPSDSKACFRVPAIPTGESVPLMQDGKVIGTLDHQNVIVDLLGTRSYRLRTLNYAGGLEMAIRLTDPNRDAPITVILFPPGSVHKLPGTIDYFLEPAPEKLEVTTFGLPGLAKASRTELMEEH